MRNSSCLIPAFISLLAAMGASTLATAQPFTEVDAGFVGVTGQVLQWGDSDGDQDLDLLLAGTDDDYNPVVKVYRNDGNGTFTDTMAAIAPLSKAGAWADYDRDGDLDIVVSSSWGPTATAFYTNLGNNSFGGSLAPSSFGCNSVTWADYNNDQYPDLLLAGCNGAPSATMLFRNQHGTFVPGPDDIPSNLWVYDQHAVDWGDYDNDGYLDILLIASYAGTHNGNVQIWHNQGNENFNLAMELEPVHSGTWAAWGDYNGDGFLDLAYNGSRYPAMGYYSYEFKLYRNLQNGMLEKIPSPGILETHDGPVAWGDYNNDGRLDLLIGGKVKGVADREEFPITKLYRNVPGNVFSDMTPELPALGDGAAAWGDYDNDGDLDLVLSGEDIVGGQGHRWTKLLRNDLSYTVFGDVKAGNSGLAEVLVTLGGNTAQSVRTSSDGTFQFGSISPGSYVLTPSKTGYVFEPGNLALSVRGGNSEGHAFFAFSDRDSDGVKDAADLCADDPLKTNPGACGCGIQDKDAGQNGIFDCRAADEIKFSLKNLQDLLKKLRGGHGKRALALQKSLTSQINQVLAQVKALNISAGETIQVKGRVKFSSAVSKLSSKVKRALKLGSSQWSFNKRAALKEIKGLLKAIS